MLVSTMAQLSAIRAVNNASYANMMLSQGIVNHAFRGDNYSMENLHNYEQQVSAEMIKNSLIYKIASKSLENNKKSLDYMA